MRETTGRYLKLYVASLLLFFPGFAMAFGNFPIIPYTITYLLIALLFVIGLNILPRILGTLAATGIALLQVANILTWKKFGYPFEFGSLQIMGNATFADMREFVRIIEVRDYLLFAFVVVAYTLVVAAIFRWSRKRGSIKFRALNVMLLIALIPVTDYFHKVRYDTYSYIHVYRMFFKFTNWKRDIENKAAARIARLEKRIAASSPDLTNKDDIVIVIIGESARRDHFSIYGYPRETTPNLKRRRRRLLIFKNATSSANSSVISVSLALSPATVRQLERFHDTIALPGEARIAGYHVIWISNTDLLTRYTSRITLMAREANELISTTPEGMSLKATLNDSRIFPFLEASLEKWRNSGKKLFIFLATNGSHWIYRYRYPKEFEKYKPVSSKFVSYSPSQKKEIINEYDNSILYTDHFLERIIRILEREGKPATLIYFSDHGQRLYDDGRTLGHGHNPAVKIEYRVPLIVWRSENRTCHNVERLREVAAERTSLQHLFEIVKFATCMSDELPGTLYEPGVFAAYSVVDYESLPDK